MEPAEWRSPVRAHPNLQYMMPAHFDFAGSGKSSPPYLDATTINAGYRIDGTKQANLLPAPFELRGKWRTAAGVRGQAPHPVAGHLLPSYARLCPGPCREADIQQLRRSCLARGTHGQRSR